MRTYPRSTLKKAIKAYQPKKQIGKDVDLLVYLSTLTFLKELSHHSQRTALARGQKKLEPADLQRVGEGVLRRLKA